MNEIASRMKTAGFAAALIAAGVALSAIWFGGKSGDAQDSMHKNLSRLLSDRQAIASELVAPPYAEAGKSPLEAYLLRIRRDGVPQHSGMRRKLAQLAEDNAQILALAEAYEPFAKSPDYPTQLRALRTYVITWNDRWYSVFETFMAGGNLAGGEPPFPEGLMAKPE